MSFLRNVLHDLVQKKLWPVAVALIVALIAVPIVLGGNGADAGAPAPTPVAGANGLTDHRDVARAQVVSLEDQAAGRVARGGKTRDPFVQHHVAKATTVQDTVSSAVQVAKDATSALGGGSAGSGSTGTSKSTGGSSDTPKSTPKTDTPAADDETYHVNLKFGEIGAEKTHNNIARLTPLPSSTNPFFVFLGLKSDGKSAVFLVDADAVPSGDGACEPSPDNCEQVSLKEGDIEFFELQSGTAGVVQYQLELTSIKQTKAATKASAAVAHARESKAGREYLRQVVADDPTALDAWDFSSKLGLLVSKEPATANLPQSVADAADGQAVENPATVLTVPATPAG